MISTGKLTSICQKRNWIMQDFVRFKVFASLTSQSESNWKSLPLSRLLGHTFNALFRITLAKWFSIQRMEIWLWSPVDNWIFMFPSPNVFVVNDNPIMDMMAVGAIWTNEVHDLPKDHLEHEPAKNNQRLSPLPGAFHQAHLWMTRLWPEFQVFSIVQDLVGPLRFHQQCRGWLCSRHNWEITV